ncbi:MULTISPECIES: hypothetical protein [Microbacterium]|jgi:hypothetical protein|uniref:Uncharacterized protein n=1 Tax=Microbacterium algeriense TaxID=2615184 RepID=A0ABQ6V4D5_9MICO|nr:MULTISPECIES: hypothetical protein [Microbacterium]AZH77229.1 hypothetical protein CSX12_01525 [Microbacterium sp. Y-01]KAB1862741.1 hypothetical protein F6A08_17240 [Microbacterium algeriense]MDX2401116.1 hypothetical protein [Microbacterium algeriense]
MFERVSLEDAKYIGYTELLDQLQEQFPAVARHRIESIIVAENDAITGGFLRIVPAEVATGAIEMLEREPVGTGEDGEVE